jgi:acetyl esterase/lipase
MSGVAIKIAAAIAAAAPLLCGETMTFRRIGQHEINADVFRPQAKGPNPVVMFIHGGALISGSRRTFEGSRALHLKRYLDSGFVVVSIDYRLAPETKLPVLWTDVEAAYRWIRRNGPKLFGADPDRIAVVGQSAGGYLTLLSGAKLKPPPRALVAWYGYGDIAADWYAKPDDFYRRQPLVSKEEAFAAVGSGQISEPPAKNARGRFYLYARQQGLWPKLVAGFDPATERKQLDRYCPVRLVTRAYPPAMLLHGDGDTDVPVEQSRQMAARLSELGVPHELVILPGRPHGFDRAMDDATVAATFEKSIAFLQQRLSK